MRRMWAWTWIAITSDDSAPGNGANAFPQAGQCCAASLKSCTSVTTGRAVQSLRPCPVLPGCCPRLRGLPSTVRTRRFFAFGAVQPLGQVADDALECFHFHLQGRFPFHKPRVLCPPVVRLPLELDIGLLRQHHGLLGKGRGATTMYRRELGSGDQLGFGMFHRRRYIRFFWEVLFFSKGTAG